MSPDKGRFVHRRRIVWGDTDAAGIVYTPRIAHFVVEAVEAWFRERLSVEWLAGPRTPFVSLGCRFISPMTPADTIDVEVSLVRAGRSALDFALVARAESRLCWTAETTCVFVDGDTFKSRPIPTNLLVAVEAERSIAVAG